MASSTPVLHFLFGIAISTCFLHAGSVAVARASPAAWTTAGATWYGAPHGAGSTGGACGYGNAVEHAPFFSLIAAGNPNLFKSGGGCGACYQVRCTKHRACSGSPVTVVITDECPGGPCLSESIHFDLSGAALGAMARPGMADQLRAAGVIQVEYSRAACKYPGARLTFHVDAGANPNYFAVLVEFAGGEGDLGGVELRESRPGAQWRAMVRSWGAMWKLDSGAQLRAPFSIRLTSLYTRRTLVATGVIPAGWRPGASYRSLMNYN